MAKGILGKKVGMTQIFTKDGKVVPVTVVEANPNLIAQVKSVESDGYNAVQIGVGVVKDKRVTNPQKGHFAKANIKPVRFIREVRLMGAPEQKLGDSITVDIFAEGEIVDVVGTSKGKGFAGTIKRHNFSRGPMAHGRNRIANQVLWDRESAVAAEKYLKAKSFLDEWVASGLLVSASQSPGSIRNEISS